VTLHATRVRRDNLLEIVRNSLIAMTEAMALKVLYGSACRT